MIWFHGGRKRSLAPIWEDVRGGWHADLSLFVRVSVLEAWPDWNCLAENLDLFHLEPGLICSFNLLNG